MPLTSKHGLVRGMARKAIKWPMLERSTMTNKVNPCHGKEKSTWVNPSLPKVISHKFSISVNPKHENS